MMIPLILRQILLGGGNSYIFGGILTPIYLGEMIQLDYINNFRMGGKKTTNQFRFTSRTPWFHEACTEAMQWQLAMRPWEFLKTFVVAKKLCN